jgi:RNA polymerase sigma factor (sigma-70 family)
MTIVAMSFEREKLIHHEDALLWQGLRNHDKYAFDSLVKKYTQLLFSYGTRFCQDRDIIKDCIQELFVEIWKKRSQIKEPVSVKWYLLVAIRNRIFREKTKWSRNTVLAEEDYDFLLEFSIEETIIAHTEDVELAKKVKCILESLPPRQREIVYLRYYENLDFEQIADMMNITKQSVHNLLQKAYKNIRSEWSILVSALSILSITININH